MPSVLKFISAVVIKILKKRRIGYIIANVTKTCQSIKAHRLFLARSSPILAAYLSNSTQTIYVEDVGVENFRALLR